MKKNIEILAPAGSYQCLKAAIVSGADAVYLGGDKFGARAFADNFDEDTLCRGIDYAHIHGRRVYLTINTLFKNKEIKEELFDYLLPYYKHGIDAVIVQDIGVVSFVKKIFPDLPIHASTQMTITNESSARFIEQIGVERVVPARELSLEEILKIKQNTKLEIECFVHGALCYCYSGQCLLSSFIGGRSGNRGQCAQPCRLPYKEKGKKEEKYLLSLKDILTLEGIPDMVEAGIDSFKIEGRMKKPEYVALVTKLYRKYTNLYLAKGRKEYRVTEKDKQDLMDLYNRGGFHEGYYKVHNSKKMLSLKRPNHAGVKVALVEKADGRKIFLKAVKHIHKGDIIELPGVKQYHTMGEDIEEQNGFSIMTPKGFRTKAGEILFRTRNEKLIYLIHGAIEDTKIQEKINGKLILIPGQSAKLELYMGQICVQVMGDIVEVAKNQPMDSLRIEKQLRKTGNTEFVFDTIELHLEDSVFYSLQALNELRRKGLEILRDRIVTNYRRHMEQNYINVSDESVVTSPSDALHVSVEEIWQYEEALRWKQVQRIYIDCSIFPKVYMDERVSGLVYRGKKSGKQIYFAMPHIFRHNIMKEYIKYYDNLVGFGFDGMLVRNIEEVQFFKERQYEGKMVSDHNIYCFNQYSEKFWLQQGISGLTAPLEANYRELEALSMKEYEIIVYGYMPVMTSAQCIQNTTAVCDHAYGRVDIQDRLGHVLSAKKYCDGCYNVILNSQPLVIFDCREQLQTLKAYAHRLCFTKESEKEVEAVLCGYEAGAYLGEDFTRGHFKRGVK